MIPIIFPLPVTDEHITALHRAAQLVDDPITTWRCEVALGRPVFTGAMPELDAHARAFMRAELIAQLTEVHRDEIVERLEAWVRRDWTHTRGLVAS